MLRMRTISKKGIRYWGEVTNYNELELDFIVR
ncbi:MAG: hypothetical protein ACJA1B_000486 [Polaribacter sp.]|jgi:hypothetical protein